MPQMQPYIVRQGDHLKRIAKARGFAADDAWGHPSNAQLKKLRTTYNLLLPGDVLYVPVPERTFLPVKVGAVNSFKVPGDRCKVSHVFCVDDKPLANMKFRVVDPAGTVLAPPGTTDGDGKASFDVAVETTEAWLQFETGRSFRLGLGHLDPATSRSGCVQRLRHLGYLGPERPARDGETDETSSDEWIAFALRAFQGDSGLPQTGMLDDPTAAKLASSFGV